MAASPPPNEPPAPAPPPRNFLGIRAVNVFVRDLDRSLHFYIEQLGFQVAFDTRRQNGDRWVAVAPPDGTAVLGLIVGRTDDHEQQPTGRPTGITFVTEDVVAKWEEWRKRGVQFLVTPRLRRIRYASGRSEGSAPAETPSGDRPPVWGGTFARFRDPDGNIFALVSFDELNRQVEAQRRLVAEKFEAERRAAQEVEIAKQVQARLFPQNLPAIATLDYAGVCIQARQVGGDYYDFLDLGRSRFGLVIADISGKGIAAALLMANLQANLRSQCAIALDEPERLLRSVNRLFHENTAQSAYATMFFAEYDDAERRLRYANCGHLPALVLRAGGAVERLESTCTVLGLFSEWDCAMADREFAPGDLFVLYTDGVTESFNAAGEEFGEERLLALLEHHRTAPPCELVASVVDQVRRFNPQEQHDDITLIVARCRE